MIVQFAFTEEQSLLQTTIDRFVQSRYGLIERKRYRAEPSGYSLENWRELAELGLLGLMVSAEDGGMGAGPRELTASMESLGRGMVVEPLLEEVILAARILAELGTAAQKEAWLPGILAGDVHVTLAHFEQSARFNLTDVRTRAERHADEWVLDGEKSLVPSADTATLWIVSAREHGEHDDPSGLGFYLVAADAAGIERRDFALTDGSHASSIRFRSVRTRARLEGGYREFSRCVDLARLAAGAEMLGIMSTMFDATLEYLRSRKQFGAALASFQALQHRLANLYVRLEQARSQVCRAALFVEHAADAHGSITGMKSYVGRAALELGTACVHLHGGIGMSEDLAVGYGLKRLLVLANLFGDPDADLMRFARSRNAAAAQDGATSAAEAG